MNLKRYRLRAWAALLLALALLVPSRGFAQGRREGPKRSQSEIARDLKSGDHDKVSRALAEVPSPVWTGGRPRYPQGYVVSRELANALIAALEHERRTHVPDGATYTGPYMCDECEDELQRSLLDCVIALKDPAAIPALVRNSIQLIVMDALLDFGPRVVPELVKWARDPEALGFGVAGALDMLSSAVVLWGKDMSVKTRADVKAAAALHLGVPPERYASSKDRRNFAFGSAMELASVLRDPDLMAVLRAIAEDEEELARRGLPRSDFDGLRAEAKRWIEAPSVPYMGRRRMRRDG